MSSDIQSNKTVFSRKEHVSRFYRTYTPLIEPLLLNATERKAASDADQSTLALSLYCNRRLDDPSSKDRQRLIASLPGDLSALDHRLGYCEADFLQWLFGAHAYDLLVLAGPAGGGKSALLHYVLTVLRPHSKTLDSLLPLHIDLLPYRGRSRPFTREAFADELFRAIEKILDFSSCHTDARSAVLTELITGLDIRSRPLDARHPVFTGRLIAHALSTYAKYVRTIVKKRPLIVFDNTDQLLGNNIKTVLDITREIIVHNQIRCVVAMRPVTFSDMDHHPSAKGTFPFARIDIRPPSLRDLLVHRMESVSAATDSWSSRPANERARIRDARSIIYAICRSSTVDMLVSRTLSCHNVKRTVACADSIFKNTTIDRVFDGNELEPSKLGMIDSIPDIIAMIANGQRDNYHEFQDHTPNLEARPVSVIPNIFRSTPALPGNRPALIYWLLYALRSATGLVEVGDALQLGRCMGVSDDYVLLCLDRCIKAKLIESPETDEEIASARHIRLSNLGAFLLNDVLGESDESPGAHDSLLGRYIGIVLSDTPLLHSHWLGDSGNVVGKLYSTLELAESVTTDEVILLERLAGSLRAGQMAPCPIPSRFAALAFDQDSLLSKRCRAVAHRELVKNRGHPQMSRREHDVLWTSLATVDDRLARATAAVVGCAARSLSVGDGDEDTGTSVTAQDSPILVKVITPPPVEPGESRHIRLLVKDNPRSAELGEGVVDSGGGVTWECPGAIYLFADAGFNVDGMCQPILFNSVPTVRYVDIPITNSAGARRRFRGRLVVQHCGEIVADTLLK